MRRKRADFHQSLGARNDAPIKSRIYDYNCNRILSSADVRAIFA